MSSGAEEEDARTGFCPRGAQGAWGVSLIVVHPWIAPYGLSNGRRKSSSPSAAVMEAVRRKEGAPSDPISRNYGNRPRRVDVDALVR